MTNNEHFLYIDGVTKKDSGFYVCELSNNAGKARKTFDVHVISKPYLNASKEITEIEVNFFFLS